MSGNEILQLDANTIMQSSDETYKLFVIMSLKEGHRHMVDNSIRLGKLENESKLVKVITGLAGVVAGIFSLKGAQRLGGM